MKSLPHISKRQILLAIILFGSFYGYFFFAWLQGKKRHKDSSYSGVIQSVTYDTKGIPTVEINGTKIYTGASFNWNKQVEQGDFIEKKSGAIAYKIIKHNSKRVLIFKN
jgi:hypothetical protein